MNRDIIREVRMVELIAVTYLDGAGVEGDPAREVTGFYTADGGRVAFSDPWKEAQERAKAAARLSEQEPR